MDPIFIVIIAALILFTALYLSSQLKLLKKDLNSDDNKVLMEWLKDMKASVDTSSKTLDSKLTDQRQSLEEQLKSQRQAMNAQTKMVWERLDEAQKVISSMKEQIGGIQEFGKDIKDLSNILKSPKLRGGLGEQLLYDILENYIPKDFFSTQYRFKDGSVCDAVVYIDEEIIPIDSKFPMENFQAMLTAEKQEDRDKFKKTFVSDVKKRIDEIASKYILPEEGTGDQAIMYIPSENVYYELAVNSPKVTEYAREKKVFMASPNTLVLFLRNLATFYQQRELQKHADDVLRALKGIKQEAGKFEEDLGVLERHVSNAFKSMDHVKSKFVKLFTKIDSVQNLGQGEQNKLNEQNNLIE
ncbi:DNA recombination protein RmuC [Patescibacteria group bacterium]|nr:DNA recombination protein RmuC [Patescibacteria group bacterium]